MLVLFSCLLLLVYLFYYSHFHLIRVSQEPPAHFLMNFMGIKINEKMEGKLALLLSKTSFKSEISDNSNGGDGDGDRDGIVGGIEGAEVIEGCFLATKHLYIY